MSTVTIQNTTITRDFYYEPGNPESEFATIRIVVDLHLINGVQYQVSRWFVVFGGKPTSYGTRQGTTTVCTETYLDKDEAFDAFCVQGVKAFTQQVTWHNGLTLENKKAVK